MTPIIQLKDITKEYDEQTVIHPLTLSIEEGEFITLLGPSGCGKTTLLRMIAGFEQPSQGDILLANKPITSFPPYKRDMNMVFQQYALFPHMNVEDNILFGLRMKKISKKEQMKRLEEILDYTELSEFRKRFPKQLSGGQQQRVAIARAIINEPKVLLLDEPLTALDNQLRKNLQIELKNLQKRLGITFVYVTHDQEEAMTMSDRIVILNQGRIEQIGTPQEVYLQPNSLFVAHFIGENNILKRGSEIFSVRPEHIRIVTNGAVPASPKKEGKLQDIIFTGNQLKLFVDFSAQEKPIIAYSSIQHPHQNLKTGDQVILTWEPKDEVRLH
ncbi:ABC transporter ATP-binding protein [Caldalkalibacillus mannanilyticus]|uniref:ABC transporter ATP-binding protein n=1 Tax=Caldalkalibacillus mannanilyticus TaxID=1418 RepID=UPI00046A7C6C|nr:ABC transporter ATP-binding protein [Caldalkalibacillus mannanilyticus]